MNTNVVPTPFNQLLSDISGGTLEQQLAYVLSDVAEGVSGLDKAGKVTLTLELKRIPNTGMVNIHHTLSFVSPTAAGKRSEEIGGDTPLHVGRGGKISAFPEKQTDLFKSADTQLQAKE